MRVVLSLPVGFVHLSQYLRGYEQWLMDIVLNPEFSGCPHGPHP